MELVLSTGKPFRTLRDEQGLTQLSDASALDLLVDKILAASPKEVEGYRAGKAGLLSFFVGQVMKESRGKANPKMVQEVLKKKSTACAGSATALAAREAKARDGMMKKDAFAVGGERRRVR